MSLVAQEHWLQQVIHWLPQLIWSSQPDGQCDFLNARWTQYTGIDTQNLLDRGWLQCVHPDDRTKVDEGWRSSLATQCPLRIEARIRRQDGTYHWFEISAILFNDGHGTAQWIGANLEIEEPGVGDIVERRVRHRTFVLEAQSEKLRALARDLVETQSLERKRLAQVLHDQFQQLVSAAKMKIGIIRRRSSDEAMIESLRQGEALLEEALNASRSLATELSPPVLHDAGLASALEWLARRMEQTHGLTVQLQMTDYLEPDNEQVRIILFECAQELLLNVVHHAGVKSAELTALVSHEGLLHIRVADHGKGFDPIYAESGGNTDGKFGLLGICERLGLIGGVAKVISKPGHGTTVELTAPATFDPKKAVSVDPVKFPAEPAPPHKAHRILRVLVADDHKLFREGLISLLSQEPYLKIVGESGDGQQAIELARSLQPDILIVDVAMPKVNGVQVASVLSKEMPEMKIVGLSMHERDDMASAMRNAGAIAYCAKSAPVEVLVHILRDAASKDDLESSSAE